MRHIERCISNRAARATKVDKKKLPEMYTAELGGAPEEECVVMLEHGPAAILVRAVAGEIAEENTNDFGIDFGLVAGKLCFFTLPSHFVKFLDT